MPADPVHLVKLLDLELAQKRAARLARQQNHGRHRMLTAFGVLFLMILLGTACLAVWRVQAMRDARLVRPSALPPSSQPEPAARPH